MSPDDMEIKIQIFPIQGTEKRKHSRMANSFLGTGSVDLKQSILTKVITGNAKFVEDLLDFSNLQKGGQPYIGTDE